jgi:CDP-diacylglycerol---glycerol-3-phosphate 3-phosphatidyltransferase
LFRESPLGRGYLKWVEEIFIPFFARRSFKPNHLTFLAFFFSLLTIPAYGYALWLGGIGVLISGIVDTLDGGLARKTHQKTKSGAFLDSVLDRYSDFFMIFGIWFFFRTHPNPLQILITPLLFLFLSGSFLVSYSRARGEGLGLSVSVGFFGRAERLVFLGFGSIGNDLLKGIFPTQGWGTDYGLMVILLLILTIGTHLTAFQRIAYLAKHL